MVLRQLLHVCYMWEPAAWQQFVARHCNCSRAELGRPDLGMWPLHAIASKACHFTTQEISSSPCDDLGRRGCGIVKVFGIVNCHFPELDERLPIQ